MKRLASLLAVLPTLALAGEGMLGTKTSGALSRAEVGAGPSTSGTLIQTVLAILIVGALLKFALPAMLRKFGAPLGTSSGHNLKIEESAGFPGGHLHVVRAGGKRLLIGTTSGSVALLSDLTEAKGPELPLFSDMVESAPAFSPELIQRLDHLGNIR